MVLQFYLKSSQRTVHILGNYGTVVQHSMFQIYLKDNEKMHLCFLAVLELYFYQPVVISKGVPSASENDI